MTKSGKTRDLGCVCFYGFTLTSRLDHLLGAVVSTKGVLSGRVPARHHQRILYELVPRMWSVSHGVDDRGNVDNTERSSSQGLPAEVGALPRRDGAAA